MRKTIAALLACFFAIGVAFGQSHASDTASLTKTSITYIDLGGESMVLTHDSADNRLVSGDGLGVFLLKCTPSGGDLWKKTWDANDTAESIQHQMMYDPAENSMLVATLQENDRHPMFVGKFDANDGHEIWQIDMYAIALEIWGNYDLALQEGGSSSTVALLNKTDGSVGSSFAVNGYLGAYPEMKVVGDTLCLFTNSFFAKFLLPSGTLIWQKPMTGFAFKPVRTYGTVDATGNVYICTTDWDGNTGLQLFAGAAYTGNGENVWLNEWYGWPDKSVHHNGNNWVNGIAFDASFNVVAIFGAVQMAGTDGYVSGNQSAYLALLNANTGDTLRTDKWDDGAGSILTEWNDGYFNRNHQLVLLGNSYSGDNFISTYDVDIIYTGVHSNPAVASGFQLSQNYPNPFNPSTTIRYEVPERSFVTLKVYNTLAQEVKTLVKSEVEPGVHETSFVASSLPSGTYFYRLTTSNGQSEVKKLLLLK